jgi:hypothetical protein
MTKTLDYAEVNRVAQAVGYGLALECPGIEAEDIAQEILVKVCQTPKPFIGMAEADMKRVMRKIGRMYVSEERYRYTLNSAQYIYTPKEVRQLLDGFFLKRDDLNPPVKDTGMHLASGGITVALWDMDFAWSKISEDYRAVLVKRYRDDINDRADRMRISRAVDALTRWLNIKVARPLADNPEAPDFEGPGSRSAMTNAASQYAIRKDF